jgi:hypothetical protein
LFEGPTNSSPLASSLETQVRNFLRSVDGLQLPAADRQPLEKQAQLLLRSEMMENLLSQRLPASQRILYCGDSLNRLGERIIGPFHQTVKIWSSHRDIWLLTANFLSGFGSSATIRAVSQYL